MTARARLNQIVEDGLCSGCGLCVAMLPDDVITFDKDETGEPRPYAKADLTDEQVDFIYQICPGLQITGIPEAEALAAPHQDLVWGPYHDMQLGWAGDPVIRHQGSTGGVLTALACYLLEAGLVKAIAHVKAADTPANFGMATISRTSQDVIEAAGSRYGPTAPLLHIDALLEAGEPFALIAKPCDLNAMRNLAKTDPRVDASVKFWLTPVCGGYMPESGFQNFMDEQNLDADKLTSLRYRGLGCPGPTSLTFSDGTQKDLDYLDFWGDDESQWTMPFRCKICPDGIGEGADIAASDSWEAGSPNRIDSKTDKGANALIIRTDAGARLVEAAITAGALIIDRQVDADFMNWCQPHQTRKKRVGLARIKGLIDAGNLAPNLNNLRAEALDASLSDEEREAEYAGALRRAKARSSQNDSQTH